MSDGFDLSHIDLDNLTLDNIAEIQGKLCHHVMRLAREYDSAIPAMQEFTHRIDSVMERTLELMAAMSKQVKALERRVDELESGSSL